MRTTDGRVVWESREECPTTIRVWCRASDFWTNHISGVVLDEMKIIEARDEEYDMEITCSSDDISAYVSDEGEYIFEVDHDDDWRADFAPFILEQIPGLYDMDVGDDINIEGVDDPITESMVHILKESGASRDEVVEEIEWISGWSET